MTRIVFELAPTGDGAWAATATNADGQAVSPGAVPPRLRAVDGPNRTALLLLESEAAGGDARDRAKEAAALTTEFERLAKSDYRTLARPAGGKSFTQALGEHLFHALIGQALWDQLYRDLSPTVDAPLELALRPFPAGPASGAGAEAARSLLRLPWEMLHDGTDFLARLPGVALTRRLPSVAGEGAEGLLTTMGRPCLLFVVGTHPLDPAIRPGAEYLGLMRSLRAAPSVLPPGMRLLRPSTHLLLQATRDDLEAALRSLRPTVVHFICHGGIAAPDGGGSETPYLELCDRDEPKTSDPFGEGATSVGRYRRLKPPDRIRAADLLGVFASARHRPQVVVLNACQSASAVPGVGEEIPSDGTDAPLVGAPFAAQLVAGGVPVAAGMAGKVTDQACRLFTRAFYTALLPRVPAAPPAVTIMAPGESLPQAMAVGRRAGILSTGLTDPATSLDWALPTLFLSDAAGEARLAATLANWEIDADAIAEKFAFEGYPEFSGRADAMGYYSLLMTDAAVQTPIAHRATELFALRLNIPYKGGSPLVVIGTRQVSGKVGAQRLLSEIAVQAVRDGHIPLRVDREAWRREKDGTQIPPAPPTTREDLLVALMNAARTTARRFGLPMGSPFGWQWRWVPQLVKLAKAYPPGVAKPLQLWTLPQSVAEEDQDTEEERAVKKRVEEDRAAKDEMNIFYNEQIDPDLGATELLAIALRHDLLALRTAILHGRPPVTAGSACPRLLLLIPRVHDMADAANDLFRIVFSEMGMRHPSAMSLCRAIFTSTDAPEGPQQTIAAQAVRDAGSDLWSQEVPLTAFRAPEESRAVYEHHLLHWRDNDQGDFQQFTLSRGDDAGRMMSENFLEQFHGLVGGLPSGLTCSGADDLIVIFKKLPQGFSPLRIANDDVVFQKAAKGQG